MLFLPIFLVHVVRRSVNGLQESGSLRSKRQVASPTLFKQYVLQSDLPMSGHRTKSFGKIRAVPVKINATAFDELPYGFGSKNSLVALRIRQRSNDQCQVVSGTSQAILQTERRTCSSALSQKRHENHPEEKAWPMWF